MAQFVFRLETLRRVRATRRDRHRVRLADAIETEQMITQRLEQLSRDRQTLQAECREAAGPGMLDVERLIERRRFDRLVAEEIDRLEQMRNESAQRTRRQRAVLVAAERELRTLERLEQRQQLHHNNEQQRLENTTMDEVAANSLGR